MSSSETESNFSAVVVSPEEPETASPLRKESKKVRVAAVQAEPCWNDLEGTVKKICEYITEAGKNGANVIGFPEVFCPGYPWSIWTEGALDNVSWIEEYKANSLRKESPEMDQIKAATKEAGIFVVLGYSERYEGSLYISQSFIDTSGEIVHHRRKIKPTHVERSVYGDGQAESLVSVVETQFGKVAGLNCWEHLQPLLRYYEYSQGAEIHIASWPPLFEVVPDNSIPYHVTAEANQRVSQFMAMEGACFVAVATQVLTEKSLDKTKLKGKSWFTTPGGGFAQIFGPDGQPLCKPLDPGEEGIIYADIDIADRAKATQMLDVVGQYSRPDLLSLNVNAKAGKHVNVNTG